MPRRGDEIGRLDPETMEWVKTGEVSYPLKDAIDALPGTTLADVMLSEAQRREREVLLAQLGAANARYRRERQRTDVALASERAAAAEVEVLLAKHRRAQDEGGED